MRKSRKKWEKRKGHVSPQISPDDGERKDKDFNFWAEKNRREFLRNWSFSQNFAHKLTLVDLMSHRVRTLGNFRIFAFFACFWHAVLLRKTFHKENKTEIFLILAIPQFSFFLPPFTTSPCTMEAAPVPLIDRSCNLRV